MPRARDINIANKEGERKDERSIISTPPRNVERGAERRTRFLMFRFSLFIVEYMKAPMGMLWRATDRASTRPPLRDAEETL